MNTENQETPRGFSKKPIIIIAAAVIIAGGGAAAAITAVNHANSPAQLITLAQKFLNDADYEKAIIQFDKVLTVDPLNVDAYIGKAEALDALGRSDEAEEVLTKALEMVRDTASPEELEKLRALLDRIKGVVVVQGTQETAPTAEVQESAEAENNTDPEDTAEPTAEAQSFDPSQFTRVSYEIIYSGEEDYRSTVREYIDEEGRTVSETRTYMGNQDTYSEYKTITTSSINGPTYYETTVVENGVITNRSISDKLTEPGINSVYQYFNYSGESESRDTFTYELDENGNFTRDNNTYYTYEYSDDGLVTKYTVQTLNSDGEVAASSTNGIRHTEETILIEYYDGGRISDRKRYLDDLLFEETGYDEWGNQTYSLYYNTRTNELDRIDEVYNYTFGEDGAPVSAEGDFGQATFVYKKND